MKGSFEFAFLMIFAMPFIALGVGLVDVMMSYNHARYLKEYAISAIEHQNRFDESVDALIAKQEALYPELSLSVTEEEDQFLVAVTFPVRLPIIDYETQGSVLSYTMLVD